MLQEHVPGHIAQAQVQHCSHQGCSEHLRMTHQQEVQMDGKTDSYFVETKMVPAAGSQCVGCRSYDCHIQTGDYQC